MWQPRPLRFRWTQQLQPGSMCHSDPGKLQFRASSPLPMAKEPGTLIQILIVAGPLTQKWPPVTARTGCQYDPECKHWSPHLDGPKAAWPSSPKMASGVSRDLGISVAFGGNQRLGHRSRPWLHWNQTRPLVAVWAWKSPLPWVTVQATEVGVFSAATCPSDYNLAPDCNPEAGGSCSF